MKAGVCQSQNSSLSLKYKITAHSRNESAQRLLSTGWRYLFPTLAAGVGFRSFSGTGRLGGRFTGTISTFFTPSSECGLATYWSSRVWAMSCLPTLTFSIGSASTSEYSTHVNHLLSGSNEQNPTRTHEVGF